MQLTEVNPSNTSSESELFVNGWAALGLPGGLVEEQAVNVSLPHFNTALATDCPVSLVTCPV